MEISKLSKESPYVVRRVWNDGSSEVFTESNELDLAFELQIQMRNSEANKDCRLSAGYHSDVDGESEEWLVAEFKNDGILDDAILTFFSGNEEFVSIIIGLEEQQWDLSSDGHFLGGRDRGVIYLGTPVSVKPIFVG